MKKSGLRIGLLLLSGFAAAQTWTTVTATNITDLNQQKLAAGQLCFLATDQNDTPISIGVGGGGQVLKRSYCGAVAAGAVTSFTVPNPANTLPTGVYYRVTVKDSSTGQEVLRYPGVTFIGATFNFDNYAPANLGSFAPLSGNSVSGNLAVSGNVGATGTVTGSNIPASIPGTGTCTNQFVRTLNSAAPPTCSAVGSLDLASSLALTTPNIGAATGASVNLSGNATVGGSLGVTGTSTLGNVTLGAANTLSVANIKQAPATSFFNILDANGLSHFFISNSAPYTNTFLLGNGAGNVFLGSAAKAFANDVTGAITTAGGITLQTTSSTLPAAITNDTAGGILFSNNAGSSMQLGNNGTLFLNSTAGIRWTGATSGNTVVQAAAVAGAGVLTLPATVTDTLVARTTTDTLTNKTLTSPTITNPTLNNGVSQGSGFKHQRFGPSCTTAAAVGAACNGTYTWTTPFADANYTVVCTGDNRSGAASGIPVVLNANTVGASAFLLSIAAFSAAAAQFPAVDCVAFHD